MVVERGLRGGVVLMLGLLVLGPREMGVMAGEHWVALLVMLLGGDMTPGGLFVAPGAVSRVRRRSWRGP